MMQFACKNLGIDCNFVATGATTDEVYKAAVTHGNKVHADLMKNMTKEQMAAFDTKLKASIKAA
ncbi:MAG TPA: DUF1059 domain-containing protein [Anaerolineales bacterium]|jgi:predicted small metal-binding protein